MQQAVLQKFPDQIVSYKFYNRSKETMKFSRASFDWFQGKLARASLPSHRSFFRPG